MTERIQTIINTYWPAAANSLSEGRESNFSGTKIETANQNLRDEDACVYQGQSWKNEM